MASSLISNTNQVYFASVLAMDNVGMVAMFEALVASGLNGFLGCLSDIYEAALVEFFQNASVKDGQVISTVQGKLVEISEEVFERTFQLPVEGLMDLNEIPKDLVTVKAGSFDAVTHERFLMMTAIYGGIKVNWSRLLFNIFKDMVTPGSRQAKGYAVQICILLKNVQNLELGDSKEFPPLKIFTAKTVGRYIAINEKIGVEEVEDVSRVKRTPAKKSVSKKRQATVSEAPVVKKKRTSSGIAVPKDKDLAVVSVALDDIPIQTVVPSSTIPAVQPPVPKHRAPKRKVWVSTTSDDETVKKRAAVEDIIEDTVVGSTVEKEPLLTGDNIVNKEMTTADEVDNIIAQVITETTQMDTDVEEPVGSRADTIPEIGETVVGEPIVQRSDETEDRIGISFAEFAALDFPVFTSETDRLFETGSESEDELGLSASKKPSQISESENRAVESASAAYLVEELWKKQK
ncbi:delphilin-like [Dorcoceras hygrometricum]|uniref:Delphilin-like n=1 Tax=Dorcoceras hygrometricum TaxID=472368 RepID=A0A2Z7BQG8_9LAMI|nr:delphilin-like [Dorcoceras hygrometricum]